MAGEHSHPTGRSAWLFPLLGVFAFVTGLQKLYILDPVTEWLRDLPNLAAIAVALMVIALVGGAMVRAERRRRRTVEEARTGIATRTGPT